MAITRAQQAKQMLQDGGRIGFKQGQSRRGGAPGGRRAGPGTGSGGGKDRDKGSDFGQFDRAVKRAKDNPEITAGGGDGGGILDKVQAADANELHVIASILEIQPREVVA